MNFFMAFFLLRVKFLMGKPFEIGQISRFIVIPVIFRGGLQKDLPILFIRSWKHKIIINKYEI